MTCLYIEHNKTCVAHSTRNFTITFFRQFVDQWVHNNNIISLTLERDTAGASKLGCDSRVPGSILGGGNMCQRISLPYQVDQSFGWDLKPRSFVPGIVYRASQRSHGTLINPGIQVGCQWKLAWSYKLSTPHTTLEPRLMLTSEMRPSGTAPSLQPIVVQTVRRSIGRKSRELFRWWLTLRYLVWDEENHSLGKISVFHLCQLYRYSIIRDHPVINI